MRYPSRKVYRKLVARLGSERVRLREPLREHTTFRIGGPADFFFVARSRADMLEALRAARELEIPFFVLGSGANVLVSDEGFRGLVVKCSLKHLEILGSKGKRRLSKSEEESFHEEFVKEGEAFLQLADLDYPDPKWDVTVRVEAGVSLPFLVEHSLAKGLTGLEFFAGIPATIGGGVYNNIHGGKKLFSERLWSVTLYSPEQDEVKKVAVAELRPRYNYTTLQESSEVVLAAEVLFSSEADVDRARWVAKEWRRRKLAGQPQTNCPGCVFKNISVSDQKRLGFPTPGVGYIIDQKLRWKGKREGAVKISEKHANFIVNLGGGKAAEVVRLMRGIRSEVEARFGVRLEPEIFFVGFDKDPLGGRD